MGIIIMAELLKGPLSGYDVTSYIRNKFNLLVSSGTVYSLMYSLERSARGLSKEPGMKEKEPTGLRTTARKQ
jgi:hypothetical protein